MACITQEKKNKEMLKNSLTVKVWKTWKLNAMYDPRLDSGQGISGHRGHYWNNWQMRICAVDLVIL